NNKIIQQIKEQKQLPNLKYAIKEKTEDFTKLLFYTLFDDSTNVEENINKLEKDFEELAKLVCWDPGKSCGDIWETYLEKLPEIMQNLNRDARAITEHDPAANSLEEVYLAYPGFFAIAIYRLSHEFYKY